MRIAQDRVRLAVGNQLAMMQHRNPLRDRHHDFHQMLDHDDGDAALRDLADHRQRIVDLGRVQPGIDLVQHQQTRLHGEALGQFQALALCERQRGGGLVRGAGEAGELQMIAGLRMGVGKAVRVAREQRARGDVFQHRHLRERLHDLEGAGEPEPRDLVGPHPGDIAAVEDYASGGRRMYGGDQIDQRRFAGAIRSDQPEDLTFYDG